MVKTWRVDVRLTTLTWENLASEWVGGNLAPVASPALVPTEAPGVTVAAHRRARQPVRITKTVGTLAAAGAAGVGLVVFCFTPANSDGQRPAANVGSAVSIDPTPDATVQSATPARVTPTASPTSTATAHARAPTTTNRANARPSSRPSAPPQTTALPPNQTAISSASPTPPISPQTTTSPTPTSTPTTTPTPTSPDPSGTVAPPPPDPSATVAPPAADPSSPAPTQTPSS